MRNRFNFILNLFIIILLAGEFSVVIAQKTAEKNKEPVPAKTEEKSRTEKSRTEIRYTGFDAKRDPFVPPIQITQMLEKPDKIPGAEVLAKDVKLPAIDLQGIIWAKTVPQVIINGSVMKAGDFIEDFQIKEIRKTGIILFFKGNDYFVKMMTYSNQKSLKGKR